MNYEILWCLSSIFFLTIASIQDWKSRLISDKIWLTQLIVSIILYYSWYSSEAKPQAKLLSIINILMTVIFAFSFFYFGAFGGADSKALIVLMINSPIAYSFSLIKSNSRIPYPSIMFLLFNMFIFFLLFAFFLMFLNIYQIRKYGPLFKETRGSIPQKLNALFSCRRIPRQEIASIKFHDPVEILEANYWKLHTPIFEGPLDDEEFEKREKEIRETAIINVDESEKQYLWMRPQPPGLIFILLAQIMWIFVGSPLIFIMR